MSMKTKPKGAKKNEQIKLNATRHTETMLSNNRFESTHFVNHLHSHQRISRKVAD